MQLDAAMGRSSRASTRKSGDLPAPFGPTSATVSPASIRSDTALRIAFERARTEIRFAAISGVIIRSRHVGAGAAQGRTARRQGRGQYRPGVRRATRMRAKVSAMSISTAPRSSDAGSSSRWPNQEQTIGYRSWRPCLFAKTAFASSKRRTARSGSNGPSSRVSGSHSLLCVGSKKSPPYT